MTFDRKAYESKPENRVKSRAYAAQYRLKNPEKIAAYRLEHRVVAAARAKVTYAEQREKARARQLKRLYGITLDTYNQMLDAQAGRCAICGSTLSSRSLDVDHDHDTGKVRGLLCQSCNHGIGHFGDSPEILREAVAYLEGQSS